MGDSRVTIGSVPVDAVTMNEAVARVDRLVESRAGHTVFTPNVDHVVQFQHNAELRAAYERASLSVPDGHPVFRLGQYKSGVAHERVSGIDLFDRCCGLAAERGYRVFLFGARPEVAASASRTLEIFHPGVKIVGTLSPPPGFDRGVGSAATIEEVALAEPDLIGVALGCPNGEIWADRYASTVAHGVAMSVGGALDVISGRTKRAPSWMRRHGFEWLYRLSKEPVRLAPRYLYRDLAFLPIAIRELRGSGDPVT